MHRSLLTAAISVALVCATPAHAVRSPARRPTAARPIPACNARQLALVRAVRPAALARISTAKQIARGDSAMGSARVQNGRRFGQAIFAADLQREGGEQVLLDMQTRLGGPAVQFLCPPATHSYCHLWSAATERPNKVYLCPGFFSQNVEEKKRTLIHEAAHLAGIVTRTEQYCSTPFGCRASCSGADAWSHADNWAQFVNCATGAPALRSIGTTVRARPRARRSGAAAHK